MGVEYREEPCKAALNRVKGMAFSWSLNPYMGCVHRCTFCYVRAFELRADRPFDERYGRSIRVKTNVVEVLRGELARASWEHESVAIGAATDPYQPAEGHYRLTRGCIEALREFSNPFSIITRGPLIIRDVDVLSEAAARASVSVTFSIPTLDEEVWRRTEPGTAHPRQRLRALKALVDAGVKASVGMAPILPGISDRPEQLDKVVRAAREAGACGVWSNLLFLRPGTREHFLEALARDYPGQLDHYERLYARRAYLGAEHAKPVRAQVAELAKRYGVRDRRRNPIEPEPDPEQLALAERRRPDVVIMDVRMPGMDGLEATKILGQKAPDVAVLIFTAYSERQLLRRGLESGAKGYILKEAPHQTLLKAIDKVVAGEGFVDPALMPAFLSGDREEMLTAREREILQLLADGMSNADVAGRLFISQETVKSHVRHILTKLEADTRTHAVAIALREAIID